MPPRRAEPGRNGPPPLTPKQDAAAVALASGTTIEQAAKATGAGYTTIKTWLATSPEFRSRVTEARAELSARVLARVSDGMVVAVDTLIGLCRAGKTETTQLKAAEALLTHGTVLTEVADLKARVATLETA